MPQTGHLQLIDQVKTEDFSLEPANDGGFQLFTHFIGLKKEKLLC